MARLVVALAVRRDSLCEGGVMARVLVSLLFAFFAPLVAWVGGYGFDERGTAAVFTLVMGAFLFVWTFFWPGWGDVRPTWGIKHASLIRCLRAAEDRIRAGDDPRDVFADFGWTIDD
jgi:hypothetical protein